MKPESFSPQGAEGEQPFATERLSEISIRQHTQQRSKRGGYYVKGPLPFKWVLDNIPDPAARLVLIAGAFMDMAGRNECALTAKVWGCAGISSKDVRSRVLRKVRQQCSGFEVEHRRGRPSVLKRTTGPANADISAVPLG